MLCAPNKVLQRQIHSYLEDIHNFPIKKSIVCQIYQSWHNKKLSLYQNNGQHITQRLQGGYYR